MRGHRTARPSSSGRSCNCAGCPRCAIRATRQRRSRSRRAGSSSAAGASLPSAAPARLEPIARLRRHAERRQRRRRLPLRVGKQVRDARRHRRGAQPRDDRPVFRRGQCLVPALRRGATPCARLSAALPGFPSSNALCDSPRSRPRRWARPRSRPGCCSARAPSGDNFDRIGERHVQREHALRVRERRRLPQTAWGSTGRRWYSVRRQALR